MKQITFWSLAGELVPLTFQYVFLAHNHHAPKPPLSLSTQYDVAHKHFYYSVLVKETLKKECY